MTKIVKRSAITAVLAFAMFTSSAHAQKIAVVDINTIRSGNAGISVGNHKDGCHE